MRRKLRRAERHLIAGGGPLGDWIAAHGKCQLQVAWDRGVYEALVRAIAHQQLHGKAAESILRRLCAAFPRSPFPEPAELAGASTELMRAAGFSSAKTVAIQGIATAALQGAIPSREQAETLSDEELIARLLPLRGVGRWTVEMLLIFTLGRLDIMPVDDYGIRAGLQALYGLPAMPKKPEFPPLTDAWHPYRSVAAWYLWRYAEHLKGK